MLLLEPMGKTGSEWVVTVTTIRVLLTIFFPKQLLGDAFLLERPTNLRPDGLLEFIGRLIIRAGIKLQG